MKNFDNIHYTTRKIDGYNLPFNFIISARDTGKSTWVFIKKVFTAFLDGHPSIILRRRIVSISEIYINSLEMLLNDFLGGEEKIKFQYNRGSMKDGAVYIYIGDKLFALILAVSIPMDRLKSLVLSDVHCIVYDEFICNTRKGEKYLPNECFSVKEIYTTFSRHHTGKGKMKMFFLGNPYSLYCPLLSGFGFKTSDMYEGAIVKTKIAILECFKPSEELKDFIREHNPLYEEDNEYTEYAFDGRNINDRNILVQEKKPDSYFLSFILKIDNYNIGVYRSRYYITKERRYFCQFESEIPNSREAICFKFEDLQDNCVLISNEDRKMFSLFKCSMRERKVDFSCLEVYYLIEEIYTQL